MATVHAIVPIQVPAQNRTLRPHTNPPLNYARPWRSSPLAGPAFSTLPPIFAGSSEESLAAPEPMREFAQSPSHSSSSIASQTSLSTSPYGSRNTSGHLLDEGNASTSSISPTPSMSAHGVTSSHGHSSSQTHSHRPTRLSKSWGRRKSIAAAGDPPPKNVTDAFVTPPPRARTISHGHSRPASFPVVPVAATASMPPAYSRTSQPHPESNDVRLSTSRDPTSNWVSSSPFGPAMTPKFSRLAMASPAVVMPLSAKEYRKRKARQSVGKGKDKEPPTSSNHVTFAENASSATPKTSNGIPLVTVSPPPSENPSSGDTPQEQADKSLPKPEPHASLSAPPQPRPSSSSPSYPRSHSRPNTPPRSSPLATQPPLSPKSSTGTFYSLAPASDDETSRSQGKDDFNATSDLPPARPRPRPRRRKSYPDRLSNGARLSFIEAMNRLSQGSVLSQIDDKNGDDIANRLSTVSQASGHTLSTVSQASGHTLSTVSQASGHTLFYDVVDTTGPPVGEEHQVENSPRVSLKKRPSATQSLENLSSIRTGGEVAYDSSGETRRMAKRNVRMVRISDTVEVSPSPVQRRRKLTKSRPVSVRGDTLLPQTQAHDRRVSLLPWKSKKGEESKGGTGTPAGAADKGRNGTEFMHPREATGSMSSFGPASSIGPSPHSKFESDHTLCEPATPTTTPDPSADSRKTRRSTFAFLSTPTFRPKREREISKTLDFAKANSSQHTSTHVNVKSNGLANSAESGRDNTSTSIHTIAQGSQTTLVPASGSTTPPVYDLTTLASSGGLSVAGLGLGSSAVPMVRRLNAQAAGIPDEPLPNPWDSKGSSTLSLVTMRSATTTSSTPRTLTASSFVPRSSALKASFTDTSEEEDRVHLHVSARPGCLGARAGSRPGSASSSATETSGSYVSLSTMPASGVSASLSGSGTTSRSSSPVLMVERRDQVSTQKEGEACPACSQCGHVVDRTTSPPPAYVSSMHPMFTVPLVTVPATTVYVPVRGGTRGGKGVPRDLVVPVYGHGHGSKADRDQDLDRVGGRERGSVVPVRARTVTMGGELDAASSSKVRKRKRPQTAPGDAIRHVEESKTVVGVDVDVGFGAGGHSAKHKGGASRLKTVLKGLLKWNG